MGVEMGSPFCSLPIMSSSRRFSDVALTLSAVTTVVLTRTSSCQVSSFTFSLNTHVVNWALKKVSAARGSSLSRQWWSSRAGTPKIS